MKKKKRKSGRAFALLLALLCFSGLAGGKEKKIKPSQAPPVVAIIAGTIYRPPGFAIPEAEVTVEPGKVRATTDGRGEFALRVPAVPASYRVSVKQKGYLSQVKTVEVQGE